MTTKFYEDSYWETPKGRLLWEIRKIMALVQEVSLETTPSPFFTTDEELTGEVVSAEWSIWDKNASTLKILSFEFEDGELCISAFDTKRMEFYFEFEKDVNDASWKKFPEALDLAKKWIQKNNEKLTPDNLNSLFNLPS